MLGIDWRQESSVVKIFGEVELNKDINQNPLL